MPTPTPTPVPQATADPAPVDMTCYIQVAASEFEIATTAILNGANGGFFEWLSATNLDNNYSGWNIWDAGTGWSAGYYGDCSPLGVGGPAPPGIVVIP